MTDHDYNITNDVNYNQPCTLLNRVVAAVFNFLTAVGFIVFAGICGYLYSKYL